MKKASIAFLIALTPFITRAHIGIWQQADNVPVKEQQLIHPDKYLVFNLQSAALKSSLFAIGNNPEQSVVMSFPSPDGKMKQFRVFEAPTMEPALAAKYPDIKTFTAVAVDDKNITAKLDFTVLGFHAMVFDGSNTYYIDPYTVPADNYYLCYYKRDIHRVEGYTYCGVTDDNNIQPHDAISIGNTPTTPQLKTHGTERKTYRLALACTGEYSKAVAGTATPDKTISLSAMVTSVNRVNGVYEREIGVHMNLIANTDDVIYLDGTTDPFTNNSGSVLKNENQTNMDAVIGTVNYDIGHVFSTGGGGIAEFGSVCNILSKAQGVTGQPNPAGFAFDIDFVAHEMGHQFGATHSFNGGTGSCTGNGASVAAYEPGSGSTIMAYAGICGSVNNIQSHSDDYFHAKSLDQISDFLVGAGSVCAVSAPSNNTPPSIPSIAQSYNIPQLTPFELIATGVTDTDNDSLRYNWEEYDLGEFGFTFANTRMSGPIFRSFNPTASTVRVFPALDKLRANITNYLGEKLPDTTRILKFKLTVRDMLNGYGTFNISDDVLTLNVTKSAGPFRVSYPNYVYDYLQSGTNATITWNVANTTAAPVSCNNVDILLSTDDGVTFPYVLATATANDGSEDVSIPANIYAGGCRIKIKGSGNVFFDMSDEGFSIFPWPSGIKEVASNNGIKIYPVPAKDILQLETNEPGDFSIVVLNILGQQVWKGSMANHVSIPVSGWAKGVYNVMIRSEKNDKTILTKAVID